MPWEILRHGLDLLLASRESELDLAFFGGEPLLRFGSIQRAVDYVETARRPGQKITFSTLTNGTLIGETEARFLADHAFSVQLSLDGTPAVQSLRGTGTFETLDALLDGLAQDHPGWFEGSVTVSATILPTTVRYLAENVEYLLSKEIRSLSFSPVATNSSSWQLDQIHQLEAQFERIFQITAQQYRSTGQIAVECLRDPQSPGSQAPSHPMCNVERGDALTVDVDGEVYGCAFFAESFQEFPSDFLTSRLSPMRLGPISSGKLTENLEAFPAAVVDAEIFHHHDRKYSSYQRCSDCEYLDSCSICPVSIGHIPGNTDPHRIPDFLCAFNLVSNRYRAKMAAEPGWLDWIKRRADRG